MSQLKPETQAEELVPTTAPLELHPPEVEAGTVEYEPTTQTEKLIPETDSLELRPSTIIEGES